MRIAGKLERRRFYVEYDTSYAVPGWVVWDRFDDERVAYRVSKIEALRVAARFNLRQAAFSKGVRDIARDIQGILR